MQVKEAMNKNVKATRPDTTIREAAKTMTENRIGSLVIVSPAGNVIGILTERDILMDVVVEGKDPRKTTANEIMTKDVITITPDETLEDAADLMTRNKIKKLPVVEDDVLIGIVTASDLVKYERALLERISELISHSPTTGFGG